MVSKMDDSTVQASARVTMPGNRLRGLVYLIVAVTLVLTAVTGFLMYERISEKIKSNEKFVASVPLDGGWTVWGNWTACSPTCGSGTQSRSRSCSSPAPKNGGAECVGLSTESIACLLIHCPEASVPLDGGWTVWGNWTACSSTCGSGTQSRSRSCSSPAPKNGGAECVGLSTESIACLSTICPEASVPLDGGWTVWGNWTACSSTCGSGTQSRSRSCSSPAPKNGGAECVGLSTESIACLLIHCPDGGPWYLIYEHNHLGSVVKGSKTDLIDKVRNGANIRVMHISPNSDHLYVTSVQNAFAVGNELCGQALFNVSKKDYSRFQDNVYWCYVMVCTTGHLQISNWNVGEHVLRSNNTLKFALKWFVREEGQTHLITLNSTGAAVAGSKSNIIDAIKQGHHVRVISLTPQGYNYFFPCDAVEHTTDESMGVCTALWQMSQQTVERDGHSILDFQLNAYWRFSLKTTNSDHKMSRWYVGNYSQPQSGNSEANTATKWYSDPCWQPVYKNDASGHLITGSLTSLVSYIKAGHRVKVLLRNLTLESDEIQIHHGHVCVSLLNDLSKSTIDLFNPTMSWVWRLCCTTGRCETMKYKVGANVETNANTFDYETLTWFVDTPRQWTRVLSVTANESVTFGSKAALINAIRGGSEVRYNLVNVFEDDPDFLIAHQADNLAIDGDDVGATHIRAISVSRPATETEITFQPNPYWWFNIITTTGRLDMSRWTVGVHQDRGHDSRQIGVDWFVNKVA